MDDLRTPPAHEPILQLLGGCLVLQSLRALVAHDVVDVLAEKPLNAEEIAARIDGDARPLHQTLRFLAGLGYFRTDADGRFEPTAVGATLVRDHPSHARDLVLTMGGAVGWRSMEQLPDVLRNGRSGVELAHGQPLFDMLGSDPVAARLFQGMMVAVAGDEAGAVAAAYDFSGIGGLVDVGGGTGTTLQAILDRHPGVHGTLFELPHVVEQAERAGAGQWCATVSGSFLDGVPAGADAYLLSHVLHNWPDDTARTVLGHCREGLAAGGRVLVVETVVPDGDEPHLGKMLDVAMLTFLGAGERTSEEYRRLLADAGLEMTRVVPTSSAVSVLEAVRAS